MRAIFVTGGGKCGTHLVAAFLHANWPQSALHPREFGAWQTELPEYLCDKFIFHCPNTSVEQFRVDCPSGKMLAMVRHPAQQYVAWLATFAHALVHSPIKDRGKGDMHERALRCVLHGFDVSHKADASWRLEDFTSDAATRLALVDELLDGESMGSDAPVSVNKTRFGWANGVYPISGNEYPSILTDEEIAALNRQDVGLAYPNWIEGLSMLDKGNEERLTERGRAIVEMAYEAVERKIRNTRKKPTLRSVEEVLDLYLSQNPTRSRTFKT